MKLAAKVWLGHIDDRPSFSIESATEEQITSIYREQLHSEVKALARVTGRLLDKLHEKGVLLDADILHILDRFEKVEEL